MKQYEFEGKTITAYSNPKITDAVQRMRYNSDDISDANFNKNIVFLVEEYVQDDIPKQHSFSTLKGAIVFAYGLFLDGQLHSIGLRDKRTKCEHCTNALLMFEDVNSSDIREENSKLKKQVEQYQAFLKYYNADKTFKEYIQTAGDN